MLLMVVDDLDILGTCSSPREADAITIVDPNAVLTRPVADKRFESVAWRNAEVVQRPGDLKLSKLSQGYTLEACESRSPDSSGKTLGVLVGKRHDHNNVSR